LKINPFNKTKKETYDNYAISLDIGTEFVKSVIFAVEDGKAVVKGHGRQRQKLSDISGGVVTDIHGVIKNCESALEIAAKQAGILPYQVIIGIAGELVKGTTTMIRYTRANHKNPITMNELKDILGQVQKKAFEKARKILAWETGHLEIDVRLVNAAIVDVKIDGYKVTNPIGFQGKEIEVGVFNAFAPIVHLGALQTIAQELDLDLLSVTAEPYSVAHAVSQDESTEFSAIFIDIGGGTTDIAIVRSGGIEGTKMFALGGRTFTKRISNDLNLPFTKAEELKMMYSRNELPASRSKQVHTALEKDVQVWLEGFIVTLEDFTNLDLLPSKILLCGGGSCLPEISDILKTSNWYKKLPFARKPTVQFIKPKDVANILDETGDLSDPQDVTPLSLANVAIDLVGKEGIVNGVMTKVLSSLKA
jgi:cell division protein FtsA